MELDVPVSELDQLLDVLHLAAGQGQVGTGLVEHQVDEDAVLGGQGTDDVVLLAQRDQDVVDGVLQTQRLQGLVLGTHDFGVSSRSQFHVHARARASKQHAATAVYDGGAQRAVY